MNKKIFIILASVLLTSCNCGVRHTLPQKYKLSKVHTYYGFRYDLNIYNIKNKINIDSLDKYPNRVRADLTIQKWILLDSLNDKEYIDAVISQTIQVIGRDEKKAAEELDAVFSQYGNFYFSGYYNKEKNENTVFNFYELLYLLDVENNKMYRFKYLKGY